MNKTKEELAVELLAGALAGGAITLNNNRPDIALQDLMQKYEFILSSLQRFDPPKT